jgi:hypothetical protein
MPRRNVTVAASPLRFDQLEAPVEVGDALQEITVQLVLRVVGSREDHETLGANEVEGRVDFLFEVAGFYQQLGSRTSRVSRTTQPSGALSATTSITLPRVSNENYNGTP